MCGRFASFRQAQDLADAFALALVDEDAAELPFSWNVAPTQPLRLVVERPERLEDGSQGAPVRQLRVARWGLVPSWAKDPAIGVKMFNARSETLAEKPAFKRALAARRGIVPAEGYFEWQARATGRKQPHFIHAPDDGVLALAALYEFWKDPSKAEDDPDRWLVSATIITRGSVSELAEIHDRQPVILPPETWDAWLSGGTGPEEALAILGVEPPPLLATPVGPAVGRVSENGPQLIEPVAADEAPAD